MREYSVLAKRQISSSVRGPMASTVTQESLLVVMAFPGVIWR